MSDSQRPKPALFASNFEVPDLELEPVPRSVRRAPPSSPPRPALQAEVGPGYSAPNLFEEESFEAGSLSLDLDAAPRTNAAIFGSSISFEDPDSFELEPTAPPNAPRREPGKASPNEAIDRVAPEGGHAAWPSGRVPDLAQLKLDPVEIAVLADYGDAPRAVQLTPAYAYRVFVRQRELKRQMVSIAAESERAEAERESTLAELARAVRPRAQQVAQFQRLFAPLVELEQLAQQRGQALSSINQELSAQSAQIDAELAQIAGQIAAHEQLERDAERSYDEHEATAKRADAKLKRVHIEMRAVTQVAEQKLGPTGGPLPAAEAAQLATLQQRADQLAPEVAHAQAEFAQAKAALGQVRAQVDALRQRERVSGRKKPALGAHYHQELELRSRGLSESETQERAALAALGRAVLGAAGLVEVPEAWLVRVRAVSERADALLTRREVQARAIDGYDGPRVRQGVQLACTVLGLLLLLIVFKLIF